MAADYEIWISELADEAWQQFMGPVPTYRLYVAGRKRYGIFTTIGVAREVADDEELVGELHGGMTRDVVRGTLWDMFRRQPIYSLYGSKLPAIALTVDADDASCNGHPASEFDPMGETVYCDGTCRR